MKQKKQIIRLIALIFSGISIEVSIVFSLIDMAYRNSYPNLREFILVFMFIFPLIYLLIFVKRISKTISIIALTTLTISLFYLFLTYKQLMFIDLEMFPYTFGFVSVYFLIGKYILFYK